MDFAQALLHFVEFLLDTFDRTWLAFCSALSSFAAHDLMSSSTTLESWGHRLKLAWINLSPSPKFFILKHHKRQTFD